MLNTGVGPGQIHALQARKALARVGCPVEMMVPSHEGIAGNEQVDTWEHLLLTWSVLLVKSSGRSHQTGIMGK